MNNELSNEEIILSGLSGNIESDLEGRRKKARFSKMGADLHRLQIIERIPQLPLKLQKLLKEDRAQVSDKTLWAIVDLEGTSTELIQKNLKSSSGVTNIDDAELTENQYFMLWGIELLYRSTPDKAFDELYPWPLADSNYIFKMGSRELIGKNPIDDFQAAIFGYNVAQGFCQLKISNVKVLKPKTNLSFKIEDAPETLTGQVKLKLKGIEIKSY